MTRPHEDVQAPQLGERLRGLQDDERLAALSIDTLHADLRRTCEEINARLGTGGGSGESLRAMRWAYHSWVWFRGRAMLTLTYDRGRDPHDRAAILARCHISGDDGHGRAMLTLVRTGPGTAEWRMGSRAQSSGELFLNLLEREIEQKLRDYGRS